MTEATQYFPKIGSQSQKANLYLVGPIYRDGPTKGYDTQTEEQRTPANPQSPTGREPVLGVLG